MDFIGGGLCRNSYKLQTPKTSGHGWPVRVESAWLRALAIAPNIWYLLLMPIYEFHCLECKRDSEVLVRSSDWKGTACPHCHSVKLEKKLSVFASSGGEATEAPACSGQPK